MKLPLRPVLDWRIETPFFYGWLILAMSFVATFAASGITQVVIGGVQDFIFEDLGWNRTTISLPVTIGTWASGLLTPFVGRITDRYGPRWLMPVGLAMISVSFLAMAGMQSVWHFWAAYIVGRSTSNPLLINVVPRTAAVNFFRRRRNVVLSLVSMSRPVGGAINIQIISLIAIHFGWRTAYRYLGLLALLLIIPTILIMRRRPEDLGLRPDGARPSPTPPVLPGGTGPRGGEAHATGLDEGEFSWTAQEALRTRAFWFITVTAAFGTLASSSVGFSMKPYLVEHAGLSQSAAAGVLSLGTFLAVANLMWGFLADRFTPRICLIAALVVAGAMTIFLTSVSNLPSAFLFAIVWGLSSGTVGSLEHMILAQYYGRHSYGSIFGAFAPIQTVALGLGPSLQAVVRDFSGSYFGLYLAMTVLYAVATALIFLARPPALPARASSEALSQAG